ncbi:MAG: hypothetical protein RIQ60_1809 [Pseudomonadota bacterium]
MKRLVQAPNLAIATLWVDLLRQGGVDATVQRAWSSSIAGDIPPDQALPEIWLDDAAQHAQASELLHALRHLPELRWVCHGCDELIEGPFTQCWQCGALRD